MNNIPTRPLTSLPNNTVDGNTRSVANIRAYYQDKSDSVRFFCIFWCFCSLSHQYVKEKVKSARGLPVLRDNEEQAVPPDWDRLPLQERRENV